MDTLKEQSKKYYASELSKVTPGKAGTYEAQIKVKHSSGETKWLSLNDDSAAELFKWMQTYYTVQPVEENRHVLKITYKTTDPGGSKVRIYSERFKQGVTISRHYHSPNLTDKETDNLRDSLQVAIQYLKDQGFAIIGKAEGRNGDYDYIISDTFKPFRP